MSWFLCELLLFCPQMISRSLILSDSLTRVIFVEMKQTKLNSLPSFYFNVSPLPLFLLNTVNVGRKHLPPLPVLYLYVQALRLVRLRRASLIAGSAQSRSSPTTHETFSHVHIRLILNVRQHCFFVRYKMAPLMQRDPRDNPVTLRPLCDHHQASEMAERPPQTTKAPGPSSLPDRPKDVWDDWRSPDQSLNPAWNFDPTSNPQAKVAGWRASQRSHSHHDPGRGICFGVRPNQTQSRELLIWTPNREPEQHRRKVETLTTTSSVSS